MKIAIIVAMDNHRVIGKHNQLPWHLPADLQYFKKNTLGKPILMGRKTYESIGFALPGRENIVITRQPNYPLNNTALPANTSITTANSLTAALALVKNHPEEVMIIGGATLYQEALSIADNIYITYIHADFAGDSFFPELNLDDWQEIFRENHKADSKNPYAYSFVKLQRR